MLLTLSAIGLLRRGALCASKHMKGFQIRIGTSDATVCRQVFNRAEYEFACSCEVQTIVDAGANIGCAAVHFASRFPAAKIIAIEPDQGNFEMLKKNTSVFPNIIPIKAALWSEDCELAVQDTGNEEWAFRAVPKSSARVGCSTTRAISLSSLRREFDFDHIDILKVDIEGGEVEVLKSGPAVLADVNVFMIECHDRWVPGGTRAAINATTDFKYEWLQRETLMFSRPKWAPTHCDPAIVAEIQKG